MRAPCTQPCRAGDHPVTFFHGLGVGAGREDFEAGFVAGDCVRFGGAESGGESWGGGIGALDLIYVCGVQGRGESA